MTRGGVAALLVPALLGLQLACLCGHARPAAAATPAAAHHCHSGGTSDDPAPPRKHDPPCSHCQVVLAASGSGPIVPAPPVTSWRAVAPEPDARRALGPTTSVLGLDAAATSPARRRATCVLQI